MTLPPLLPLAQNGKLKEESRRSKASTERTSTSSSYQGGMRRRTQQPLVEEYHDEEEDKEIDASTSSSGSSSSAKRRGRELQLRANKKVLAGKAVMLLVLAFSTAAVSTAVFLYLKGTERDAYQTQYAYDVDKVLKQVPQTLQLTLNVLDSYVVGVVAYNTNNNHPDQWPYITVPNFAVQVAKIRSLTKGFLFSQHHKITTADTEAWENYTAANEGWINETLSIQSQDPTFRGSRTVDSYNAQPSGLYLNPNPHPDKHGNPMYFPKWQSNPLILLGWNPYNWDLNNLDYFPDLILPEILQHKAVISPSSNVPIWDESEEALASAEANRAWFAELLDNETEDASSPASELFYPILSYAADSVMHKDNTTTTGDEIRDTDELIGVVSISFFWKDLFRDILPVGSDGLIAVVSNTCGQSFTYELNGPSVTLLGTSDLHDPSYDHMKESISLHTDKDSATTTALELGSSLCYFGISVYPSQRFEDRFYTDDPVVFAAAVLLTFLVSSAVFFLYDCLVESRQRTIEFNAIRTNNEAEKAKLILDNARQQTRNERELNDFIAHEVRNPVSAAMAACSFVKSAISNREELCNNPETIQTVRDDVQVIDHSLNFVADLLRNMLDMHRAADKKLKIELQPVDVLHDILEPSGGMLYRRSDDVKLLIDCPPNLVVETDRLRLKQVVLNLGRNSSKFISKGYIRLKARVVEDGTVEIAVEDSGVGVPEEKRRLLFQKFQDSLDVLSQGTGIGLFLCKNLVELMDGDIFLDENFVSGVEGCPGTRIVIRLNKKPSTLLESVGDMEDSSSKISMEEAALNGSRPRGAALLSSQSSSNQEMGAALSHSLPETQSVLFVDDDAMLRKLFSRSIKRACPAWTCQEAGNGEAALLRVEQGEKFDIMFVDQYMSSVEKQLLGTETVSELRSRGVTSLICGLSANDKEEEFLKAGADGFIFKPFPCKTNLLKAELERLLSKKENDAALYQVEKLSGHKEIEALDV